MHAWILNSVCRCVGGFLLFLFIFSVVSHKPSQAGNFSSSVYHMVYAFALRNKVGENSTVSVVGDGVHVIFAEETQTFSVYEINDLDRDSPPFLPFSLLNVNSKQNKGKGFGGWLKNLQSTLSGAHVHGIGDLVPFSNKVYYYLLCSPTSCS